MALGDPVVLTINGTATNFPNTGKSMSGSEYRTSDGTKSLQVAHTYKKARVRSLFRLNDTRTTADPLVPATNVQASASIYLVIDRPSAVGYTAADVKYLVDAIVDYLDASTGAAVTKLLNGES